MSKKKHNPTLHMKLDSLRVKVDKLESKVDKLEVNVGWLKSGYWIQASMAIGSFISILALVLRFVGVI